MKRRYPQLIRGMRAHQYLRQPETVSRLRWEYVLRLARFHVEGVARRVAASRREFPWKFFRGDLHAHSQHSDGIGTVQEIAEMARAAGLDFQFVTDHWGVTQAAECRRHGLWVGQEPLAQHHHLCIIGLDRAFTPGQDLAEDIAELKRLGAVVYIPHPTGWWPVTQYNEEQKRAIYRLPSPLLMEIANGANNITAPFDDKVGESYIDFWDNLLLSGKIVHGLGNTDTHTPHGIGMVWNGVFAPRCDQPTILRALCRGRSFVSNAPLVHLALGRARMGGVASVTDRRSALKITAVDSAGLAWVRVVGDAKEIAFWHIKNASTLRRSVRLPKSLYRYVRVEVRSVDGSRAYSNPIYFRD